MSIEFKLNHNKETKLNLWWDDKYFWVIFAYEKSRGGFWNVFWWCTCKFNLKCTFWINNFKAVKFLAVLGVFYHFWRVLWPGILRNPALEYPKKIISSVLIIFIQTKCSINLKCSTCQQNLLEILPFKPYKTESTFSTNNE